MSNLREFTDLGHRSLTKRYVEALYYVMEPHLNNSACALPKQGKTARFKSFISTGTPIERGYQGAGSQKYEEKKRIKREFGCFITQIGQTIKVVDQYQ